MEVERRWGEQPGWLSTLPVELQERLIADLRVERVGILEAHKEAQREHDKKVAQMQAEAEQRGRSPGRRR